MNIKESSISWKNQKKKTCRYYGKVVHVEKTCWKKNYDLEEKVKELEGDVVIVRSTSWSIDAFTFKFITSQVFHAHMLRNEYFFDFNCTHHMAKDNSPFSSMNTITKMKIYVANYFSLYII